MTNVRELLERYSIVERERDHEDWEAMTAYIQVQRELNAQLGPAHIPELQAIARENGHLSAIADGWLDRIRTATALAAFQADHARDPVGAYLASFERREIARYVELAQEPVTMIVAVLERALDVIDGNAPPWRSGDATHVRFIVLATESLMTRQPSGGYRDGARPSLLPRMLAAPNWVGEIAFIAAACAPEPPDEVFARIATLSSEQRRELIIRFTLFVDPAKHSLGASRLLDDADPALRSRIWEMLSHADRTRLFDRFARDLDENVRRAAFGLPGRAAPSATLIEPAPSALRSEKAWTELRAALDAGDPSAPLGAILRAGPSLEDGEQLLALLRHPAHDAIARTLASHLRLRAIHDPLMREVRAFRPQDGIEDEPREKSIRAMATLAYGAPALALYELASETRASVRLRAFEVLAASASWLQRDALTWAIEVETDPAARAAAERALAACTNRPPRTS